MAKKKVLIEETPLKENISIEPLEGVMADRYATYAKYVIQDRAIPDVRDGLKPVQRRILYSMFIEGNTFNKPTKKCAHTVGTVMGKYHPHGDTSIYEALVQMSKDWKYRAPLIDFQGNNGSIDGDSPAAYRYTEARLSELSNEMLRDLDKNTVDMQLTFDDTALEPTVLPARFPNLLVNGSEGIAVAMATEIPPHNLGEISEAIIYRINHKNSTIDDLLNIVKGPDFPTGGTIYQSSGLKEIYETGRGRIEVASKCDIVSENGVQQIVITEIPYKVVKINLVYEIDKIRHAKFVDGILEVRDESDFSGIRIVVDLKKGAPAETILKYLMAKTSLKSSYSANMVAIFDGRPKTLNLLDFVDAYINHQVEVITRRSKFDLKKSGDRLHIVDGLIQASLNIERIVEIIKASKDKANSKENLMKEFSFTNEQAEAIVMMPLYKLSHTDETILEKEKNDLEKIISELNEILNDPKKLDRIICKDLKNIVTKYGTPRRTVIEEKNDTKPIDKRDLIAKEEVMVSVTRDGYIKRSTLKSVSGSGQGALPAVKNGDNFVMISKALTTDFLICFTNLGNYLYIPVYLISENKWKEEGIHVNNIVSFSSNLEKIIKVVIVSKFRDDIFAVIITKNGQIKRTSINQFESARISKPISCMKLMSHDEVASVKISSGNNNILVLTANGEVSLFNENELTPVGIRAGGIKSMMGSLQNNSVAALLTFEQDEKSKIILVTDKACQRIYDVNKVNLTPRLGKPTLAFESFKNNVHHLVSAFKVTKDVEKMDFLALEKSGEILDFIVDDFHLTQGDHAKTNIAKTTAKTRFIDVFSKDEAVDLVNSSIISTPVILKEKNIIEKSNGEEAKGIVEQISIFDDIE
jgi:topoisomerase-4 subunit A